MIHLLTFLANMGKNTIRCIIVKMSVFAQKTKIDKSKKIFFNVFF